jgi:hypothetical protein
LRNDPSTAERLSSGRDCLDLAQGSTSPIGRLLGSGANFRNQCNETLGTLRGSCGENSIPNFGRSFAVDAKLADFELTFPDRVHQFNAGDGD